MQPKITIITPSFNQGHFIEETICSILDQKYSNLEYIIMDGGSKDNTVEVIKKYEKHITYWVSEKDKGQSDAINKGFRMATGDVINWLNSDDYYEKDALWKVADAFSDPSTNVYLGISRIFGNKGEFFSTGTDVYADNLEKTIGWARIDQPETFFRKSCLDTIGFLDQQFHFIMDKELWINSAEGALSVGGNRFLIDLADDADEIVDLFQDLLQEPWEGCFIMFQCDQTVIVWRKTNSTFRPHESL
jgi:glycosyltransferase involved in cell wall biosynthesis